MILVNFELSIMIRLSDPIECIGRHRHPQPVKMQVCVPVVQRMMARTPATVQAVGVFMMTVPMCCRDSN